MLSPCVASVCLQKPARLLLSFLLARHLPGLGSRWVSLWAGWLEAPVSGDSPAPQHLSSVAANPAGVQTLADPVSSYQARSVS